MAKKTGKSNLKRSRVLRHSGIPAIFLFGILLGLFLGNLDRLGGVQYKLLAYRQFLPRMIRVMLPGENAGAGLGIRGTELAGKIIDVHDGDTATLLDEKNNLKYKVRFYGIDAPESSQEFGPEAGDALRRMIFCRDVTVEVKNLDPYGRVVGKVYIDGVCVNQAMLSGGFAWFYSEYAKGEDGFEAAAAEARRRRLGLWSAPDPRPPWEYRHGR